MEGRRPDASESQLVERARGGDVAAYEALVRRYQELAFRVAYVVTGSVVEAEDATQDGFVWAYYALGRFRRDAPLRPWLLRIVAYAARNRRSSASRRPTVELALVESVPRMIRPNRPRPRPAQPSSAMNSWRRCMPCGTRTGP